MKREETIRLSSGARLRATVQLDVDTYRDIFSWQFWLDRCPKGKRTFERVNIETEEERQFVFEVARNLWVTIQPEIQSIPIITVTA